MRSGIRYLGKGIWLVIMIVIAIVMLYPFLYSFIGALNKQQDFGNLGSLLPIPKTVVWTNFSYAFSDTAIRPFINTVFRTAWYTAVTAIIALFMGYTMARYEFKGKKLVFFMIICSQVIPGVMTLIPSFLMMSKIPFAGGNNWMGVGGHGLINNPLALYLPLGWGTLLWVFLFMQTMRAFPKDFEEAAEIDGCGFMDMMLKIVGPMQKPILAVIAVNTALNTWNDWLIPFMYIDKLKYSTLPAYIGVLTTQLQEFSGVKDYPRLFGLACVAIVPPFLIFIFLQKYIVEGIASTGIKG